MKQYVISAGIAVLIMGLGLTLFTKAPVNTTTTVHEDGTVTNNVGAVSTLDNVDNPFVSVNGLRQYYFSSPMIATSSVVCSVKNPFGATSTILIATNQTLTNPLGAPQSLYISTSSTAYASSSVALVASSTIKQGQVSDPIVWTPQSATTTSADVLGPGIFLTSGGRSVYTLKPGEFINWKTATVTPQAFSSYMTGTCTAIIQKL